MGHWNKDAGKFRLELWDTGHPVTVDLKHEEPNGTEAEMNLFGAEELYDLKFAVDRAIAHLESIGKHNG
jgi:hypothetical protein